MERYLTEQKKKISKRIREIRETTGYTTFEFARLMNLTENTINNLEAGEGFNSNTISIISFFTGLSFKELFDFDMALSESVKNTFIRRVKKYNIAAYTRISNRRITIKSIIEKLVAETTYFKTPRKTSEVRDYIIERFDQHPKSSIVSQALSNAYHAKLVKRVLLGLRNYQYYA